MKVTLVAHEVATPGGMERQLGELGQGLLARGHELTVITRECGLQPHPRLRVVHVRGPRRPFSLWFPWFFVAGTFALWRHRRGLVHTTGALVANRSDLSTVHFCHRGFQAQRDVARGSRGSRAYRANARLVAGMSTLAERLCYRPARTRRLVAVSAGVARELAEFFPAARVEVVPNGVDPGTFLPDGDARRQVRATLGLADEALLALFVGGDWERKGLRFAVDAVARDERWHLLVVGTGDPAGYRGDRIHFQGPVADTAAYYAAADAFVLPTAYETFSLVTYEAAAAGLPLLVSRVSGVEDLLVQDRNGWFIERDPADIAARLEALADDGLRRGMGTAARQDSARFGWDRTVEGYESLYRELAAEPVT